MTPGIFELVHRAVTEGAEGGLRDQGEAGASGDRGGVTLFGVSQRLLDSLSDVDRAKTGAPFYARDVTPEIARRIGAWVFWEKPRIDTLWALSPALTVATYDGGFQHGPGRAVEWLQLTVGAKPDRDLGPATRAAIERYGPLEAAFASLLRRGYFVDDYVDGDGRPVDPRRRRDERGLKNRLEAVAVTMVRIEARWRRWDLRAPLSAPVRG